MAKHATSLLLLACAIGSASSVLGNPHGINSGTWALHVPMDLEPFESLNARSLGMGNAFVAAVDDSTASVVNPAALAGVQRIRLDASLRYSSYDAQYLDTYAAVHNIGLGPELEEIRTFSDDIASLSFLGATIPVLPDRLSAALYYKSSDFQGADSQKAGPTPVLDEILNLQQQHASEKSIDEYQKNVYGVAAAFKFSKLLSFGATVNLESLNADLRETWTTSDFSNYVLQSSMTHDNRIDGDDTDVTFGLGVMIRPTEEISAGISYRSGGSFAIDYSSFETDCSVLGGCSSVEGKDMAAFDMPDVWSAGAAWRLDQGWLISVQADFVEYSALTDASTAGITLDEDIDDEIVLRAGAEKSFQIPNGLDCQLRAGFFTDPDHDGFAAIDSDRIHGTLGGGIAWSKQARLDLGTSFSEDAANAVLSLSWSL